MIQIGKRYTRGKNGAVIWSVTDYDPQTDFVSITSDKGKVETKPFPDWVDMIRNGRLVSTL